MYEYLCRSPIESVESIHHAILDVRIHTSEFLFVEINFGW